MTVTQKRLKEVLHYNPENGIFVWRVNISSRNRCGDVAGTLRADGYIRLQIDGVRKYATHWAYLYMTGALPADEVDHIDRDRANNRWSNLRLATKSQNCANRPQQRKYSKLPRGVSKRGKKFIAMISVLGDQRYLGIYDTPSEAHKAYSKAATEVYGAFSMVAGKYAAANDNDKRKTA